MSEEAVAEARPVVLEFRVTLRALVRPEPEAGGYSAEVPALPGCHTQGETLDEVRSRLREAAEGWLVVAHDEAVSGRERAGSDLGP